MARAGRRHVVLAGLEPGDHGVPARVHRDVLDAHLLGPLLHDLDRDALPLPRGRVLERVGVRRRVADAELPSILDLLQQRLALLRVDAGGEHGERDEKHQDGADGRDELHGLPSLAGVKWDAIAARGCGEDLGGGEVTGSRAERSDIGASRRLLSGATGCTTCRPSEDGLNYHGCRERCQYPEPRRDVLDERRAPRPARARTT
jgi:hypothetical protein